MMKRQFLLHLLFPCCCLAAFTWPVVVVQEPRLCSPNQTFDITSFACLDCGGNRRPRGGPSRFGCECADGWVVVHDAGFYGLPVGSTSGDASGQLQCRKCPAGSIPTRERDECVKCGGGVGGTKCHCEKDEIRVERGTGGTLLEEIQCHKCSPGNHPSPDASRCVPCLFSPIVRDQPRSCNCTVVAGVCLPQDLGMEGLYVPGQEDEVVQYGREEVHSALFKENVKVAAYMCYKHKNATACQLLGNLCALSMHDKRQKSCDVIFSLTKRNNFLHAPQLYFSDRMTSIITREEEITNVYNVRGPSRRLNITAARYSLGGELLSMETLSGATLQMCNGSFLEMDGAFDFGTEYRRVCKVPVQQLFARRGEPEFYDLYIPYEVSTASPPEKRMFAVPMLLKNFGSNQAKDNNNWIFTSRMFLVDTVGAIPVSGGGGGGAGAPMDGDLKGAELKPQPRMVRYLSKLEIRVSMINTRESPEKAGRMYPPVIAIEYGEASLDDLNSGKEVEFEFGVTYEMEIRESKKDIEISVGVLSVFAVLWSGLETWSWSRRSGKVTVDPMTLAKFLAITCGNLAHVFLVVVFFTSLYWFIFFKEQNFLHVILPSHEQEKEIRNYVISIFVLKIVDIVHLLLSQISVDIFLLDWERPHAVTTAVGPRPADGKKEMAVSVWRTYLVANEWNELQTRRKTHLALQIVLVVFLLRVCGLEHLATADPKSSVTLDDGLYHSPSSLICRFALGACIYLAVAIAQALFWCGIYSGLVEDKLKQFTDVCSLANISVFVMANNNFGYYVHGKSAHGFADTDMATLLEQLQREADDFCGHRGLQAGSDDQTFSMSLPSKLRHYYDNIVVPAADMAGLAGGAGVGTRIRKLSGNAVLQMVDAYGKMNKFLARFLEHALRDLDYEVRQKLFLEKILDVEFLDTSISEKAVFYSDGGNSFDAVLFYGHEFSLTIFDMMVFLFVDLFAQDFLLAGLVTFIVGEFMKIIRYVGGKSNLARKTLIDKRFLI